MFTRRDVLKLGAAGAFAAATARAVEALAGASSTAAPRSGSTAAPNEFRRLTTADLRNLAALRAPKSITRTGRTRHFLLTMATAVVEPMRGHRTTVRGVNGISPGPVLRMTEGDDVEIVVVNRLAQPTSIHWHGVPVPFAMDGAGMISQEPIDPGERFTYRWTAPQAGTYAYHSHFDDLEQESVAGMIVVEPQEPGREPRYAADLPIFISSLPWETARDVEAQAVLGNSMLMPQMAADPKADPKPDMGGAMDRMDMVEYWCFNGKSFPDTEPIKVKAGNVVRLRFANFSHMAHPIHLHGHWFRWIAQDASPLPQPHIVNTLPIHPGQTADVDFIANNPGVWPLHCHILGHMVDNHDRMAGLMTVVQYEGYEMPRAMRA